MKNKKDLKGFIRQSAPYLLITAILFGLAGIYLEVIDRMGNGNSQNGTGSHTSPTYTGDPRNVSQTVAFKNLGPAPEFTGIEKWFNSEPQTLEKLKGKVTLVNFWSYSSIAAIKALPTLAEWHERYKDPGLTIVGVHTPQYVFEKPVANIESAIQRYKIPYSVAADTNYRTWIGYGNQFWPAYYLIDKDGNILYTSFGEGNYDRTESAIRTLLGLEGEVQLPPPPPVKIQVPDVTFGLKQLRYLASPEKATTQEQVYTFPKRLPPNRLALEGLWKLDQDKATLVRGYGKIRLNFNAAKVYFTAQSIRPTTIKVWVDGKEAKGIVVEASQLYTILDSGDYKEHILEIEIPDGDGFQAFSFKFG